MKKNAKRATEKDDPCHRHRIECKQCARDEGQVHLAAEDIMRAANGAYQVLADTENAVATEGAPQDRRAFSMRAAAIRALLLGILLAAERDIFDQTREPEDEEEASETGPRPVPPADDAGRAS